MSIGKRVKQQRKYLGMSQKELSRSVGVAQGIISYLENGENAGTKHLSLIADILGVDALWLQTGKGKPDVHYVQKEKESNPIVKEMIKVMNSTDARGQQKMLIGAKDILDLHNALKKSMVNFQGADLIAAYTQQEAQKTLSTVIKAETTSDVSVPDNDILGDKRH